MFFCIQKIIGFCSKWGSSDRNCTSIRAILSYYNFFLQRDLDALVVVRTPPYFSVLNSCERFMCVANIALVGVALARTDLEDDEKYIKNLNRGNSQLLEG